MDTSEVRHPGERIKAEVFPAKMSVTKAAELMASDVRHFPTCLTGKCPSLPIWRLASRAFGFPRKDLLEMQAQYDAFKAKQKSVPTNARMSPVPGNQSQRHRELGFVQHRRSQQVRGIPEDLGPFDRERTHGSRLPVTTTPSVPAGTVESWRTRNCLGAGWPLGLGSLALTRILRRRRTKITKSVAATDANDRASMEFVFVTPRRWAGKTRVTEKKKGSWKDVRAYDSSDLEQWVEQSLPGQAWLPTRQDPRRRASARSTSAGQTGRAWRLHRCPARCSVRPSRTRSASSLPASRRAQRSIVVAADSTDEALAFVAQCFGPESAELEPYRYQILVFDKAGVLPKLAGGTRPFIPVVHSREVELELAPYAEQLHSIVVYPRNSVNAEPDIVLEPVSFETFDSALKGIGKNRDEIKSLANESGCSLTVLRRRLATVEAVRMPLWATRNTPGEPNRLHAGRRVARAQKPTWQDCPCWQASARTKHWKGLPTPDPTERLTALVHRDISRVVSNRPTLRHCSLRDP